MAGGTTQRSPGDLIKQAMVPGACPPSEAGALPDRQFCRKDVGRERRSVKDQERVSVSKASSFMGVRDKWRPARSQAE